MLNNDYNLQERKYSQPLLQVMPADLNMIFIDGSVNDDVQERHLSRPFVMIKKKSEVI